MNIPMVASASFTRPANTTEYTAGAVVSTATGAVMAFTPATNPVRGAGDSDGAANRRGEPGDAGAVRAVPIQRGAHGGGG